MAQLKVDGQLGLPGIETLFVVTLERLYKPETEGHRIGLILGCAADL